ncbi:MAG: GNAT family N-acetyltransferase [Rikenellaceae bacterium]|nr:GNAT family N-acetyltransferase [Rikenellaceae bacterium]MCL2693193.1 GNAT family N-acetyltransferase [Rikenellaceae bacterium]
MRIGSLALTDFDAIFRAFTRAFADYEMQLSEEQLRRMLRRRGFAPELSFAAFDGDEIVSFTLNGIGRYGDVLTAYDTGTGTLPNARGRGLATEIFEHSIPFLRQAGVRQYLLEVLQHNERAVSVYRRLGFEVTREFNYSIRPGAEVVVGDGTWTVEPIGIEQIEPAFRDFRPSWQNSVEAIVRAADDFIFRGVFVDGSLVGYCVFEPAAGDVTQLAVAPAFRRRGIATSLLGHVLAENRSGVVRVVNTDVSCASMNGFLAARGLGVTGKQFEMVKMILP